MRRNPFTFLTLATAFLLAAGGLLVAPSAQAVAADDSASEPTVTATVTGATETALQVSASATGVTLRGAADVADTAKADAGVYFAVVEEGQRAALEAGDNGIAQTFVWSGMIHDGAATSALTLNAVDLDRAKSYELIVWRAHGTLNADRFIGASELDITEAQWNAMFAGEAGTGDGTGAGDGATPSEGTVPGDGTDSNPDPAPAQVTVVSTVTEADAEGITIHTEVSGITDPSAYPAGVHVGVVLRGTAAGAKQADFLGSTASIMAIPGDGNFTADVRIAADSLERGLALETVVWPRRSNPVEANIVGIAEFDLTDAQWDAVFPLPAGPQLIVTPSTDLDPAGQLVTVRGTGYNPNQAIYVTPCADRPLTEVDFNFIANGCTAGAILVYQYGADKSLTFAADGSFEITMMVAPREGAAATSLYTIANHTAMVDRSQDAKATLAFAAPVTPASLETQVTRADATGVAVSVSATDLPGPIYGALIERGTLANVTSDSGYVAIDPFPVVVDGESHFTLVAPAKSLDASKQYEVIIWKQHSEPTLENLFARGDVTITAQQWESITGKTPGTDPTNPGSKPKPRPGTPAAGSLVWGVSQGLAGYVTGPIAKGAITTTGVGRSGGAYLFPQVTSGDWNAETATGTVRFSGVVDFSGHGGFLSETFANPVITVHSATSATLTTHGESYPLNLAAATKRVGTNGDITWSKVPVAGSIAGGGSGSGGTGGGAFGIDPLTFTVGAANTVSFGSTTVVAPSTLQRTAAETAPATTGITLVTPADQLVAGGEIEFEADGFEANERGILVVLYSDPIVLDRAAGADDSGKVRWIGNLPDDITGTHTLTLQGSINAGTTITIQEPAALAASGVLADAVDGAVGTPLAAGITPSGGSGWVLWGGAAALLVLAAGVVTVVVRRRQQEATLVGSVVGGSVRPTPSEVDGSPGA